MTRSVFILSSFFLMALSACNRSDAPQQPAITSGSPSAPAPSALSAGERERLLEAISTQIMPRPVWLAVSANDAQGMALAQTLADVFREARWDVKPIRELNFTLKKGMFFMVGDDEVPSYVMDAHAGLEAAGFKPTLGSGYRDFYAQMKKDNPNWNGIPLDADQLYVIAVSGDGRNAEPPAPAK